MMGGKVAKFGIFSPAVIVAKVVLGEKDLNKVCVCVFAGGGRGRVWNYVCKCVCAVYDAADRSAGFLFGLGVARFVDQSTRGLSFLHPTTPVLTIALLVTRKKKIEYDRSAGRRLRCTRRPSPSSATSWARRWAPVRLP